MDRPKRALLLEDDDLRGRALRRDLMARGYEVVWCRTYEEARAELSTSSFDLASLDYNLQTSQTGADVAFWIATAPVAFRPGKVQIHSSDEDGSSIMLRALTAAGIPAEKIA